LIADLNWSAAHIAESAHADLCQCDPRLNSAGRIDARIDDSGPTRQPEAVDAEDIGLVGHRVCDLTCRFVHSQ
jgi:hypothetical protein